MNISEIAFRFSKTLNQLKTNEVYRHKVDSLQKYVRDEMFFAIKHRVPAQEYYIETKSYILEVLNSGDLVA